MEMKTEIQWDRVGTVGGRDEYKVSYNKEIWKCPEETQYGR